MAKRHKPITEEGALAEAEEPSETLDLISVRSTHPPNADGSAVVVLWEKNPAHPGGEVFIAGPAVVSVAMTPAVSKLLRDGDIEEVTED